MRYISLLPGIVAALTATAQSPWKDKARAYVDLFAGPAMHGRGYVAGGDSIAAERVAAEFARLGLEPLDGRRFQPFTFPVNTFPDSVRLSVDGRSLVPGTDFIVDPASGPAQGTYRLVDLTLEDLLAPERRALTMGAIAGNAARIAFPSTTDKDSLALFASLEREVARYAPVLRTSKTKLTWGVATEQHRNAVLDVRSGLVPDTALDVVLHVAPRLLRRHTARNVLGMVPARGGSKDWVIVSAHYDHLGRMGPDVLFPGANDNASGLAMLLCLAEQVKREPLRKNVLFVAFAGEEAGLRGSEWFVADRPVDLARVAMVLNLDLNGTGDEGITVVNSTAQQRFFDELVSINTRDALLPAVKPRGPACNSDHCPFVEKGVPAVFIYTMGGIAAYHDVQDRPETLPLTEFEDLHRLLTKALSTL
jgi:hypothetical protein